ncbi:MAG: GTP cyclohydrolase II [Deltaproteobacteria bacterium]|nr:GTP cyclohydrolase II [Deltaproteobacteria bacterium]
MQPMRVTAQLAQLSNRFALSRGGEASVRTEFGTFTMAAYRDAEGLEHLAVMKGDVRGTGVLCRVHSECLTGEVFHSRRCECGPQLHLALRRIEEVGRGVVIYLRQEGRGIGLLNKLRAYALQDKGADTLEANVALGFAPDLRRYDVAAAILRDLGTQSVVLMSNNPDKVLGLQEAGIVVERREPHQIGVHEDNERYMETKRLRMGHLLGD